MIKKIKTILITGGSGFIGSHFVRHWLQKHPDFRVVNLDKLTYSGNPENLRDVERNKRYIFERGDIADQKKVEGIFKKYKPTHLINFAAETHVDRSIHEGAKEFIDTNIYGTFILLEAIKKYGLEKAVFVSTDEVYGSLELNSEDKFSEKTQYKPKSAYSATKASADLLCGAYFSTWKLPILVTHCSNNYGPHQYPEKLVPFFILKALADKPLPLYGDGKNVRDWIYVLDHVLALEKVLLRGRPGEIYNIGADKELSNIEIARRILEVLKKPRNLVKFVADRPGHDRRYAIDFSKIKKEFGWRPKYDFDKMLAQTVKWYIKNQRWLRSVQNKTDKINAHIK